MRFDDFVIWALPRIFMPMAYICTIGLAIHIRMTYPEVAIEEGRAMPDCLGLDLVPLENPSEWPIIAKKVSLGLMFIGSLAFLGYCFGKVITSDSVGQIIFSIAAVGIGTAAWYRGKNIPQPVYVQCPLCGERAQFSDCCALPVSEQLSCEVCAEW
jgi:hypothetical protein